MHKMFLRRQYAPVKKMAILTARGVSNTSINANTIKTANSNRVLLAKYPEVVDSAPSLAKSISQQMSLH